MSSRTIIFIALSIIAGLVQFALLSNLISSPSDTTSSSNTNNNREEEELLFAPGHARFQTANVESDGFFTDIDRADWERLKHRLRTKRDHADSQYASGAVTDPAKFYQNSYEPSFTCLGEARIGGMGDGPKWVCDPHRIVKMSGDESTSQEQRQLPESPCLVYSVGCAGKVEFERGLQEYFGSACEMHVFDVTGYNKRNGNFTTIVQGVGGTFHQWGIGTAEQSAKNPTQFHTMRKTVEELGHAGRTIDLFKIDCEGCEWYTYKDWFEADVNIRQILVEVHSVKKPETFDFFKHLEALGYIIFHKEANVLAKPFGDAWEYGFIKLSIPSSSDG